MHPAYHYLWVLILAALAPRVAAGEPSFDCAKAGSGAEAAICGDPDLAALDVRMAARYDAALAAAKGLDAGSADAVKTLRATQRGWIKGRDDCWKADDLNACIEMSYLVREGELVALWMLEAPQVVASYACADNPANEITAYFFATQLPAVRLEYGDTIRTGWLTPAASGSKYATAFGGLFWTKGDSAVFSATEGMEMTCKRRP